MKWVIGLVCYDALVGICDEPEIASDWFDDEATALEAAQATIRALEDMGYKAYYWILPNTLDAVNTCFKEMYRVYNELAQ